MDRVRNPYAPGAGTPPPELAGRSALLADGTIAIQRIAASKPVQSMILVGLRGVGKTVLLNRLEDIASECGCRVSFIEAHESKTLPELLAPQLRSLLNGLSLVESSKELARRGLRGLKGFLSNLRVSVQDIELGLSIDAEGGLADSGDLETDLPDMLVAVAEAAKAASKPIALLIDELQYLSEKEFSAVIMAIHKINQKKPPSHNDRRWPPANKSFGRQLKILLRTSFPLSGHRSARKGRCRFGNTETCGKRRGGLYR